MKVNLQSMVRLLLVKVFMCAAAGALDKALWYAQDVKVKLNFTQWSLNLQLLLIVLPKEAKT